jgi:hypothetical protein
MKKRGNETFARTLNAQKLYKSVIACGVVMQARSVAQKFATVFRPNTRAFLFWLVPPGSTTY